MGFNDGHNFTAWSTERQRCDLQGVELARCSLLGNTFQAQVEAWLRGLALYHQGFLKNGRTSPYCLRRVLCKVNAYTLAGHI